MYDKIIFIKLRSLLRAFKITKIIQSNLIYRLLNQNYEAKFEKRILSYLKRSTTVYDIGANIGYYSKKFCAAVGPNGKVYAFEPISSSAIKIKDLQKEYKNLKVIELALGEKAGNVQFSVEPNPNHPITKLKLMTKVYQTIF